MWSPRVQSDRMLFAKKWRDALEQTQNLDFYQDTIKDVIVKSGKIEGVVTSLGIPIKSKCVVLTNGTFLNGLIHIGRKELWRWPSWRKTLYWLNPQFGKAWFCIR